MHTLPVFMSSARKQYPFDLIESKWQKFWDQQGTFRAWNPGEAAPESHPFRKRHGASLLHRHRYFRRRAKGAYLTPRGRRELDLRDERGVRAGEYRLFHAERVMADASLHPVGAVVYGLVRVFHQALYRVGALGKPAHAQGAAAVGY